MGLEQVKKEILEKANQEAKEIAEKGKKEADSIMEKTKAEIESYRKMVDEDGKKLIEGMERKAIASAEFDVKKMKLDRKKEMIDLVFGNVSERLQSLSEQKREADIKKLLAKARKEIEVKYVHANPKDEKIINRMHDVKYMETDIIGGIVAESHDLSFSIDLSYDEMLEDVRKKYLQEIAKTLFG